MNKYMEPKTLSPLAEALIHNANAADYRKMINNKFNRWAKGLTNERIHEGARVYKGSNSINERNAENIN